MRRVRRGYALLEMLAIIAALALIMALSAEPMRMLLSEIPKADRHYQVWMQTMGMLQELRSDIEQADTMELAAGDFETGNYLLTLKKAGETVNYTITDEHSIRKSFMAGQVQKERTEWALPGNRIRMEVLPVGKEPAAIAVKTWTQDKSARVKRHFEQTYVFFRTAREE